MKIVDWYIQVLESGKNTKTLLKDYIESQTELKALKETHRKTKNSLTHKLTKTQQ